VLALRGARSDVLTADTAREMQSRGPRAEGVEFPDVGHAPWLVSEAQIAPVRKFLLGRRPA
jgi:pimeloyl-ACP methyl ester carboxylesterase